MKKGRLLAALVTSSLLTTHALAQAPPDARAQVLDTVRAYVEAYNKPDPTAIMDLVSRNPLSSSIGQGKLLRGWDSIRSDIEKNAALMSSQKIQLGVMDAQLFGATHALVVSAITITSPQWPGGQLHGAMSLVLEKTGNGWKVLNEHTSLEIPGLEEFSRELVQPPAKKQ